MRIFCNASFGAFQIIEKEPSLKFICLTCFETLNVAFDFKQTCEKSMAASRMKVSKLMMHECQLCSLKFETVKQLEEHSVSHSIDLTEDDSTSRKSKSTKQKNDKKHRSHDKNHGGVKIRFKIPMRPSKHSHSSSSHRHSSSQHGSKSNSKVEHSKTERTSRHDYKCPICEHRFQSQGALSVHVKWHDIKKVQYKCPGCSLVFIKKDYMNEHIRHSHEN